MKKLNFINTIIFFLILIISPLYGQDIYIQTSQDDIYKIESDYSLTYITSYVSPYYNYVTDIAISPAGILYGIENFKEIVEINIDNGEVSGVADFPNGHYTSLVCGNNHKLYTMESIKSHIYTYDILNNSVDFIDSIEHLTPGDLTFYKGNLIFQSYTDGNIKAYNLERGVLSNVICTLFPAILYGITNQFDDCDSQRILGFSSWDNNLYELDVENGEIIFLQHYDLYDTYSEAFEIYGMTSTTEHLASECEDYFFEDIDCNVVNVDETIDKIISVYPNPANDFIIIENGENITSLNVFSSTGKNMVLIDSNMNKIDVRDFPIGVYFLQIYIGDKFFTKKILIK